MMSGRCLSDGSAGDWRTGKRNVIDASVLRNGQPQVNLSETLSRIPGVFAANRQNYAQDLQVSSRGFGARAAFGVTSLPFGAAVEIDAVVEV